MSAEERMIPYFFQRAVDTQRITLTPPAPVRAIQWAQALDLLDVQIRALSHEPDIAHALLVLWEMLVRLRREDTSP